MWKTFNPNVYPSGGFWFRDSDGSIQRAGSWKRVIEKVRAYRARNKLEPGNPEAEVQAQLCVRQPGICSNAPALPVNIRPEMPFKARVLGWFRNVMAAKTQQGPLKFVSDAESRARANICATCPLNTPTGVATCDSCKQSVQAYRSAILGDARPRDGRLGGCKVLNSDLPTAVHLDEIRVDNAALPRHCWRKIAI